MNRKKWIIALAILNLVLLPFTLAVACGDVGPASVADAQQVLEIDFTRPAAPSSRTCL